jgi:hypothetical protein
MRKQMKDHDDALDFFRSHGYYAYYWSEQEAIVVAGTTEKGTISGIGDDITLLHDIALLHDMFYIYLQQEDYTVVDADSWFGKKHKCSTLEEACYVALTLVRERVALRNEKLE